MTPNAFVRRRHNSAALSYQAGTHRRGIQIGPRIRIGGSVGKVGQQIKVGAGQVLKKAAPIAAMVPGLGTIAAGALGGLGTALDTSHGSVGIGDIALGAVKSGGLGALGGIAGKIPGVSSLGGVLGKIPGVSAIGGAIKGGANAIGKIPGVSQIGHAIGDAAGDIDLGSIGDFLGEHGDQLLQGAGAVTSALDAKSARDLENKALGIANGNWEARAPLRVAGVNGMANSAPPDLSALYSDTGNPYARKRVKGVTS